MTTMMTKDALVDLIAKHSPSGDTVNALMVSGKADLCEGACYNDTRVEVALA